MAEEKRAVNELAAAIIVGSPVDWDAAESTSPGPDRELIPFLRLVARIADAHRSQPDRPRPPLRFVRSAAKDDGPADAIVDVGFETWGHLRLLEPIGAGAFGQVYRAWDTKLDREVALKLVDAGSTAGEGPIVIQEGRLLARLRHPNVVTVFGADEFAGRTGLWMDLIKGRTLADVLVQQGPMGAQEAALAGLSVCRALSAVHRAGLVHRDIKAANVMREEGGRVLLMDFGTGHLAADLPGQPRATLAGTPVYLAPELFGGAPPTVKSDIYSVGVLLFHLVTRAYPVPGGSLRELQEAHGSGRKTYLRDERADLPDAFIRVVEQAIASDPEARFESAGAMEAALAAVVSPEVAPPAAMLALPVPAEPRPRHRWLAASGVAVAIAAAALVAASRDPAGRARGITGPGGGSGASGPAAPPPLAMATSVVVRKVSIPGGYANGRPSPDGRMFSFSDATGNLAVVEMATGTVRRLTTTEPDTDQYALSSAFSADGQAIAYTWHALDGRSELRVIGADGKRNRVLVRRDDVEDAQPMGWSRDGRLVLADFVDTKGVHRLSLVDAEDGEVSTIADLAAAAPRHACLSPDGAAIVFDAPPRPTDTTRDIFIVNADGSGRRALIEHPGNDHSPVWTPDGRRLLFASDRSGAMDVWAVDVADGAVQGEPRIVHRGIGRMWLLGLTDTGSYYYQLLVGAVEVYAADLLDDGKIGRPAALGSTFAGSNISSAWSPDGRRVAFSSRRGLIGFDRRSATLVVRDLETSEQREHLPPLNHMMVRGFSPDGRQVLLLGQDLSGRTGAFGVDVETGRTSALLLASRISDEAAFGGGGIAWMPDGERLLYPDGKALRVRHVAHRTDEVVLDFRAEKIDGINGGAKGRGCAPSPDGEAIAFSAIVREGDTYGTSLRVKSAGQPSRELARVRLPEMMVFQDWMPDGRSLLFTKNRQGQPQSLWRVSADGGEPEALRLGMGLRDVRVHPDGRRITFTSGAPSLEVWVMENFLR